MKITPITPPRTFTVGIDQDIAILDCARLALNTDEQVTFTTEAGGEYDVTRKNWGFYATPSLNSRLASFGLRSALVRNTRRQFFVMLVEKTRMPLFEKYLRDEQQTLVCWLDDDATLRNIEENTI